MFGRRLAARSVNGDLGLCGDGAGDLGARAVAFLRDEAIADDGWPNGAGRSARRATLRPSVAARPVQMHHSALQQSLSAYICRYMDLAVVFKAKDPGKRVARNTLGGKSQDTNLGVYLLFMDRELEA